MSDKKTIIYVDSGSGLDSDERDGTTKESAFMTLDYALRRLPLSEPNTQHTVIIVGPTVIWGGERHEARAGRVYSRRSSHNNVQDSIPLLLSELNKREVVEELKPRAVATAGLVKLTIDALLGDSGFPEPPRASVREGKHSPSIWGKKQVKNKSQSQFRRGGRG